MARRQLFGAHPFLSPAFQTLHGSTDLDSVAIPASQEFAQFLQMESNRIQTEPLPNFS